MPKILILPTNSPKWMILSLNLVFLEDNFADRLKFNGGQLPLLLPAATS